LLISYPSGRLAVLRLRSPSSTTLFFDDTNSTSNQFLGLVTSTGSVLLMQPTLHARFVTDNKHERAYLCNGKTGTIEKQLRWSITNNSQRESVSIDEDDINPPLLDNIVQLQLNSFMQLEYHNSTNILFAFSCQNEEFKFQLGAIIPIQSSKFMDLTKAMIPMRRLSEEKKLLTKLKSSNLTNTNELSDVREKQPEKLLDKQVKHPQLPMMGELILLRKRIKHICQSWLKECRTTLGKILSSSKVEALTIDSNYSIFYNSIFKVFWILMHTVCPISHHNRFFNKQINKMMLEIIIKMLNILDMFHY
jgi:hypothetical protein